MADQWKFAYKHFEAGAKKEVSCGDGWLGLVEKLISKLSKTRFDWKISKITRVDGKLKVFAGVFQQPMECDVESEFFNVIYKFEEKSASICESCGKPGTLTEGKTSCDSCK